MLAVLAAPVPRVFSWIVLLVLLTVLGVSAAMFWLLVRRWTSHRHWVDMSEWGAERGFRFRGCGDGEPPEPLSALPEPRPLVRMCMAGGRSTLLQLQPSGAAAMASYDQRRPRGPRELAEEREGWNLLLREVDCEWPPTGLRPAANATSVIDLFPLTAFPTLDNSERFVVYGANSAAAEAAARSSLRPLLPPDVGLLLHGRHAVIDFSARPFDPIEFDRMLALAEQIEAHLCAVNPGPTR